VDHPEVRDSGAAAWNHAVRLRLAVDELGDTLLTLRLAGDELVKGSHGEADDAIETTLQLEDTLKQAIERMEGYIARFAMTVMRLRFGAEHGDCLRIAGGNGTHHLMLEKATVIRLREGQQSTQALGVSGPKVLASGRLGKRGGVLPLAPFGAPGACEVIGRIAPDGRFEPPHPDHGIDEQA